MLSNVSKDPEPTKEEIRIAKQEKHCPYCKGQDFRATFDISGRNFWVQDSKVEFDEREEEEIFCVQCNICLGEVPIEVWEKWNLEKEK